MAGMRCYQAPGQMQANVSTSLDSGPPPRYATGSLGGCNSQCSMLASDATPYLQRLDSLAPRYISQIFASLKPGSAVSGCRTLLIIVRMLSLKDPKVCGLAFVNQEPCANHGQDIPLKSYLAHWRSCCLQACPHAIPITFGPSGWPECWTGGLSQDVSAIMHALYWR